MLYSNLLLATLLVLPQSFAQQVPDGVLVPFTTALPACASKCGPLFDVQGGCSDKTCFCADARLQAFRQAGTAGVSSICGPASCTTASDLGAVKSWYTTFCNAAVSNPITTSTSVAAGAGAAAASTPTSVSSSAPNSSVQGGNDSWFARHTRWVIMIIVVVVGLALLWVGAWFFRRRYLRKREREIEMSPPVAWGPQPASGNRQYGDGVIDATSATPAGAAGGHHKEMASAKPTSGKRLTKSNMGWFKANR